MLGGSDGINRPTVKRRQKIVALKFKGAQLDALHRMRVLTDARTFPDVVRMSMRVMDFILSRMELGWRFQMRNDDEDITLDIALLPLQYDRADKSLIYSRDTRKKYPGRRGKKKKYKSPGALYGNVIMGVGDEEADTEGTDEQQGRRQ